VGGALREFRTHYGVPSSFEGATLPGAHAGGVYIDARRTTGRMEGEWTFQHPWIDAVSAGGNAVRFEQTEFEKGGFVGTRFGQLAASGETVVRLRTEGHRAAIGVAGQWRDMRAEGSYTGTRPAVQRTVALFLVDEFDAGPITILAGVRGDHISTVPLDSTETLLLRDVRTRRFSALTGALGMRAPLGAGFTASVQVARAFRPPGIEELFSAGPHLASYAYEVGVPSLEPERGSGLDGVLRWQGEFGRAEVAAYAMSIADYIVFSPQIDPATGLPMRDPRLRRYVVYRPGQVDARLFGAEARVTLTPTPAWLLDLAADLPRGRSADGSSLPFMPAATTRFEARRFGSRWSVAGVADLRMAQRRVPPAPPGEATCDVVVLDGEATALPAEFCPADGALLLGLLATIQLPRPPLAGWKTTLSLSVDNLLDARWRDPLWRAGLVAPQPGRNLRFTVQVSP
jgi:iron complex outermembrane recepter protein